MGRVQMCRSRRGTDLTAVYPALFNSELVKLSKWFAHNKLTLKYSKLEYIDFSRAPPSPNGPVVSLHIDGNRIKQVTESKFLGVNIDKNLTSA